MNVLRARFDADRAVTTAPSRSTTRANADDWPGRAEASAQARHPLRRRQRAVIEADAIRDDVPRERSYERQSRADDPSTERQAQSAEIRQRFIAQREAQRADARRVRRRRRNLPSIHRQQREHHAVRPRHVVPDPSRAPRDPRHDLHRAPRRQRCGLHRQALLRR